MTRLLTAGVSAQPDHDAARADQEAVEGAFWGVLGDLWWAGNRWREVEENANALNAWLNRTHPWLLANRNHPHYLERQARAHAAEGRLYCFGVRQKVVDADAAVLQHTLAQTWDALSVKRKARIREDPHWPVGDDGTAIAAAIWRMSKTAERQWPGGSEPAF